MKVLLVTNEFPPVVGGVGRLCANLACALTEVGVEVNIVTTVGSPEARGPAEVVQCVRSSNSLLNRKYLKMIPTVLAALRVARRVTPCVLIAATCNHEGLVALALRALTGLPYCVLVHGSELHLNAASRIRRRLMMLVLGRAAFLVANSSYTRELVSRFAPETDVVVIPPPVEVPMAEPPDSSTVMAAPGDVTGDPVLLTTARLVPRKRHGDVIRAVRELQEDYPRLVYYVTGDGPCRRALEELAASLGVSGAVRLLGRVDERTLDRLYRSADVYVSPGSEDRGDVEGFGISLAEASSYGLPVVTGRGGGVGEAVVDETTGLLITPGNLEELTGSLRRLLSDRGLAERLGRQGRAWVSERFGFARAGAAFASAIAARLQPQSPAELKWGQVCTQKNSF